MKKAQNAYAVVILAAGNSSRLGEPKQLLTFQNKTLIRHVAEVAMEVAGGQVIVVTGSSAALIENQLAGLSCQVVFNPHWSEGMASSIVKGITLAKEKLPDIAGCILAVSDQPFVTAGILQSLIDKAEAGATIVAASYEDTIGTPVLFTTKYFDQLLQLKGSEGAKKLLLAHRSEVHPLSFPLGKVDIDTQEDYQKLLRNS
ncbi:nucleotidyltransferase family protein [Dyadobacter crusticola]|uniref:nucleotidyltransferase family protein n=1 Tax=Dyadobacter crusticola TaxID=292407 RepID=UPI0004E18E7E|nr:nucleotidyltransferase family protein [Dyadobacter crusticola]